MWQLIESDAWCHKMAELRSPTRTSLANMNDISATCLQLFWICLFTGSLVYIPWRTWPAGRVLAQFGTLYIIYEKERAMKTSTVLTMWIVGQRLSCSRLRLKQRLAMAADR